MMYAEVIGQCGQKLVTSDSSRICRTEVFDSQGQALKLIGHFLVGILHLCIIFLILIHFMCLTRF